MLDADQLLQRAREETGLEDLNGEQLFEALQRLVDALNQEAELNAIGAYRAAVSITKALKNRLKIEYYFARHPEVLEQTVERPIFIAGLPRTGTTALHHMMNEDPAIRTIRLWEAEDMVPPAETATYLSDPRIQASREGVKMTEQVMPGFFKTHLLDAEAPDECHLFFNQTLVSVEFTASYNVPSYTEWVYQQDFVPLYAYHKKQMQLLQSKKPGRWALKTPLHQLGLRAILANHPEAVIVQTHRSPMSFVPSGFSFNELIRKGNSDHVDRKAVGRDWMRMLELYTGEFEAARAELEPSHAGQFIDVYHDDFVANPWPSLEKIYAAADVELTDQGRAAMQAWLARNPKGKHGQHEYCLEDYGVTAEQVENLFRTYSERYQLS